MLRLDPLFLRFKILSHSTAMYIAYSMHEYFSTLRGSPWSAPLDIISTLLLNDHLNKLNIFGSM